MSASSKIGDLIRVLVRLHGVSILISRTSYIYLERQVTLTFTFRGAQYMQIGMSRDAIIEAAKRYVKLERATKAKLQLNNYWIFQIVARSQFPP